MTQSEKIKQIRLRIDTCVNSTTFLKQGREVSLCYTKLQLGKMWLGKLLGTFGNATPYPQGDNAQSKHIEPKAEHTLENYSSEWSQYDNETQKVKHFRAEIQKIVEDLNVVLNECEMTDTDSPLYAVQTKLSLEEAKMWLGEVLNTIFVAEKMQ